MDSNIVNFAVCEGPKQTVAYSSDPGTHWALCMRGNQHRQYDLVKPLIPE